jgi:DNA-binding transcriptional regulator YiaG
MAYHYTESGLDNIWLENGYTIHETAYGTGVSIQDTEGLHRVIGRWVVSLAKPLNGAEARFLRLEMDTTQKNLAAFLGVNEQAVRRWEKARAKPVTNGSADRLLRAIYIDYVDRRSDVYRMIKRLADLDQVDPSNGRFYETDKGWQQEGCAAA